MKKNASNKIKLYDRVRILKGDLKGRLATVIVMEEILLGVELDSFSEFAHDMEGVTEYGYGSWLTDAGVEVVGDEEWEEDKDCCEDETACESCMYSDECANILMTEN